MLKRFKSEFNLSDPVITVLLWTLFAQAMLYFMFFVVLPQSWALIDDYWRMLAASQPDFHFWPAFKESFTKSMGAGRFKPLNELFMALRMDFFPVEPRAYRFTQWAIVLGVHVLFYRIIRQLGMSSFKALLGVFIASFALSTKEMILYWSISEPLMLLCLFASFSLFLSKRLVAAYLFFVAALATKEPAVGFLGIFVLYALIERKSVSRQQKIFLASLVLTVLVFIAYVKSLPQIYTTNYSFTRVSPALILNALVLPPLKNYAFLFLVSVILIARFGLRVNRVALLLGLSIAVGYTLVIAPWGPFDSWFYLHIPVPFGWALATVGLWPEPNATRESKKWHFASFLVLAPFAWLLTVNGASNYREFLNEAKRVADVMCEESIRNPNVPLYSNCQEAAEQLRHYLKFEGRCKKPPEIAHVRIGDFKEQILLRRSPYIFVYSSKCDYPVSGLNTPYRNEFRYWTVYKNFGQ